MQKTSSYKHQCDEGLLVVLFLSQLQTPLVDFIVLVAPVISLRFVYNLKEKKKTHTQKQTKNRNERGRQALTNESFYWKTNISDTSC